MTNETESARGGSGAWNRRDADLNELKKTVGHLERELEKLERLAMSLSYAIFGLPELGQPNGLLHRFGELEGKINKTYTAIIALLGTFIVSLVVAVIAHFVHP